MKTVYYLVLIAVFLASCSSAPSANTVQTAIAQTQTALPSPTIIPTSTPSSTDTPSPTLTPTITPSPTDTPEPVTVCLPGMKLIDIAQTSGLGIFVTVYCSKSDSTKLDSFSIILPKDATDGMIGETLNYLELNATAGRWNIKDLDSLFTQFANDCSESAASQSGEISGACIATDSSKVMSFKSFPK